MNCAYILNIIATKHNTGIKRITIMSEIHPYNPYNTSVNVLETRRLWLM